MLISGHANAQEALPLWEAGAGVSVVNFAQYRGPDQRDTYVLPLPYLVYRGEMLKIDRQGLRGMLFDSRRVELDLRLPARAVIASNLHHARHVGWIFQPQLDLDLRRPFGAEGWNLGLAAGPVFADRRYNDYFYGVSPAETTAQRAACRAGGGYAGTQFIAVLSKRFASTWFGAFIKVDDLRGAAFEDSPLVRQRTSVAAGLGLAWIIAVSDRRVDPPPASAEP